MPRLAIVLFVVLAAGCARSDASSGRYDMSYSAGSDLTASAGQPAPLDRKRSISERDCGRPLDPSPGGNLRCK